MARVEHQGQEINLGPFLDEDEAARAYDRALVQYHGVEGATGRTNFPVEAPSVEQPQDSPQESRPQSQDADDARSGPCAHTAPATDFGGLVVTADQASALPDKAAPTAPTEGQEQADHAQDHAAPPPVTGSPPSDSESGPHAVVTAASLDQARTALVDAPPRVDVPAAPAPVLDTAATAAAPAVTAAAAAAPAVGARAPPPEAPKPAAAGKAQAKKRGRDQPGLCRGHVPDIPDIPAYLHRTVRLACGCQLHHQGPTHP